MKTKFSLSLTLVFVFLMQLAVAQEAQKQITGTVTDNNGLPVPGVNITIVGTTQGTVTNFDGIYTIEASTGQTLKFTAVGFQDKTVTIGTETKIDVVMKTGTALDKVVVTALGISREKRSLGYATQEVSGEELAAVPTSNFTNALSGRVSGLNITGNNNFGGSTNVVIRGRSSITGNNSALFVINGIPVNNRNTNTSAQKGGDGASYDYGSPIADMNPANIESINVLKGAAATALYGSRAANGVVIITTKDGAEKKGLGVTISSGVQVGFIDKSTFPTYQNKYGAGYENKFKMTDDIDGDGVNDKLPLYKADASFGPRFDPNLNIYQWYSFDPDSPYYLQKTPWVAAKDGPIEFFETPVTLTNSISIANGMENGSYRIAYNKKDMSGLMPNSNMHRNSFSFTGTFDVNDDLTVTGYAKYTKTDTKGRNSTGYNDNIVTMFRQWFQTNVGMNKLEELYNLTGRNITWNPSSSKPGASPAFWDNPYWTRYENYQNDTRNHFTGKIQLNYDVNDWFSIAGRISTDTYSTLQEERRAEGSVATPFGLARGNVTSGYLRRNINFYETNYNLLLKFDTDITEDLNFHGFLGGNVRRSEFSKVALSTAGGLKIPGLYSLQNSVNPLPNPLEIVEKEGVDGIYANASFGYDNMLYLEGSIRRDHVSTLPDDNSVFYYPSVSASFVFSQLLNTDAIDFGKFRINYAEVGNGAPVDRLYDTYTINNDIGTYLPSSHKNPNLKPERQKSFEVGLSMDFLDRRLGFDVAYYSSKNVNQIINTPISTATGYYYKLVNAGKMRNRGVELTLNITPVKTEDFTWNLTANWSKNENEVLELPEGINTIQLGSFQGGISIEAEEGQPIGIIKGTDYVYDENGNRLINGETDPSKPGYGMYQISNSSNNVIGDVNPDWLMGISNSFSYKNLTFSFLIDIQQGGSIFSLDQYYGEATGLYPNSVFINDLGNPVRSPISEGGGFINPGVLPDGSKNTHRVPGVNGQFGYQAKPNSAFVYDASFVKLRNVSLTYTMPKKMLKNTFLNSLQFSLTGNNLWIISKNMPYADPESGLSGDVRGFITGAMPTTQQYGFSVKAQF